MAVDHKLVGHWRNQGLQLAEGVAGSELLQFESKYGLTLPVDFREYLLCVNGMAQVGGLDHDLLGFGFWPLADIRPMTQECAASDVTPPRVESPESYFVFADYMQWSWAYAIRLGPTVNRVIAVGWPEPILVASTFSEFVRRYISDDPMIYPRPTQAHRIVR